MHSHLVTPCGTTFSPGMEHPSWWCTCIRSSLSELDIPVTECDATLMELARGRWREPGCQVGQYICTPYAVYVTWLLNNSDTCTMDQCTLRTRYMFLVLNHAHQVYTMQPSAMWKFWWSNQPHLWPVWIRNTQLKHADFTWFTNLRFFGRNHIPHGSLT